MKGVLQCLGKKIVGKILLAGIILFQFGLVFEARAQEEAFPNRPVQIIVAWSPGSAADVSARIVAPYLEKYFKQPFVIVNKPGGGARLGYTMIAKAKPDGYTIGQLSSVFSLGFIVERAAPPEYTYDDFEPICGFVKLSALIVVNADAPWKTLQELVADAKTKPGSIRYSTQGHGCVYHVAMIDFCNKAGIKLTHIPQTGVGAVVSTLLGKHVELAMVATTLGHLSAGRVRALAVATEQRLKRFPDIPTVIESGYNLVCDPYSGHVVPKGVPKKIKEKLTRGHMQVLKENEKPISDAFLKLDEELVILNADEYAKIQKRHYDFSMRYKGVELD